MLSSASLSVTLVPCSANINNENTSVKVSTTFKWILPLKLVKMIDQNSTIGSDITLESTGYMRCMN
jgi:hypothetical protein